MRYATLAVQTVFVIVFAFGAFFSFPTKANAALTDSLVSYWKLDSNGTDAHGSNTFTATGVSWDTSVFKLGTASGLLSTSDSLSAADAASLEVSAITLSFWVKTSDTASNLSFVQRYDNGSNRVFRIPSISGSFIAVFYDSTNNNLPAVASGNIADGNWHHLVYTVDASNVKCYVDGSLVDTQSGGTLQTSHSAPFVIGTGNPIETGAWDGNVDEVAYWGRALTSTEVTDLYNAGAGLAYPLTVAGGAITDDVIIFE